MIVPKHYFQKILAAIFTTIIFHANSISAQIVKDTTLPNNSSITTGDNIKIIEGGTQAGNNLFHSFEQFSLPTNQTAYFNNPLNIQNIITRITGKSISNIDGILRTNGTANLFLINPNGIVFGENAALDIGGSFLATTASSINFADGTIFSATQLQNAPLLTISVPIGLQFGATAAPIRNQSQASVDGKTNLFGLPVGLQVPTGKTLALVGGDVSLEGGNLTADSGRIELGSVAANNKVSIQLIDQGFVLGYEGAKNFHNIQILGRIIDDSTIGSTIDGSGSISVQGDSVELIGPGVFVSTTTEDIVNAGSLTINARKLIIRDGAQILSATTGKGTAGNLSVNASESVELIGVFSGLSSSTFGDGNGGNLTITTSKLFIHDGAGITVETSGRFENSQFILANGKAGNLIVNASELVELTGREATGNSSFLASTTLNSADAGNLSISTKRLVVKDGAEVNVGSKLLAPSPNLTLIGDPSNLGNAGELNITADSIVLENQGKLISETDSANGGDINLQLKDLLLLRRNSQISTNAGKAGLSGDGGNININIPNGFIVALPSENSDITANAFTGNGGRVDINATGIFGMQPRSRDELAEILATDNPRELNPQELLTSDITAISQQNPNLNGELNINVQDVEPTREVVELPNIPVDTKVSQVCRFRRGNQSEFVINNRGGLPPKPSEALRSNSALDVDWVELQQESGRRMDRQNLNLKPKIQKPIVEATRWVTDKNGDIFFVAGTKGIGENHKQVGC